MALRVYNGTDWDDTMSAPTPPALSSSSNTSLSTTPALGPTYTAPNTTNAATGIWFYLTAVPTSGDIIIELMESGVSVKSVTINRTDLKLGYNYARFTTPHTFTTTAANAYGGRITKSSNSTGTVARGSTLPMLNITYDATGAIGATDDAFVMGFQNSGLTAKTLTITGTSNSWGSGTDIAVLSTTNRTMGAALHIGNGGTVAWDTSASAKLTLLGSVFTTDGGVLSCIASSTLSRIATLEINNNTSDGQFGIVNALGTFGGQFIFRGATVPVQAAYASGLGTAASPVITQAAHGFSVGDELLFGGATDYLKNEARFVISVPSATQLVLSATAGGAESALAQTHAVGSKIANTTRNCVIQPTNTARGFIIGEASSTGYTSELKYTRLEYANCGSGKGIQVGASALPDLTGLVMYRNSTTGRANITLQGNLAHTISDVILYDPRGTNFFGQSGFSITGKNKTVNRLLAYGLPSGTTSCAGISVSAGVLNTFNDCHMYGMNAQNSSTGYAIGLFTAAGTTFNDCTVNGSRYQAILDSGSIDTTYNDCTFGTVGSNTADLTLTTDTFCTALFNNCTFGSATLVSNYLNALTGTEIRFFEMDGSTSKHKWFTNYGSAGSSGSGLSDTTVRTASSLAVVIKPENSTDGFAWEFLIPASPASQCGVFGYGYRNATFSSGTFNVELFLPGSTSADASYTFATTTGSWLPFNISAYYSGSTSRYATVRITAITATAGAYAFIDDLYDAGTGNKVAGLDVWYEGKPSPVMVAADYSAVPALVWGYSDATTNANTMGDRLVDAMPLASYTAPPSAATISSTVWAEATRSLTDKTGFAPTVAQVATEVWATTTRALTDKTGFAPSAAQVAAEILDTQDIEVGLSTREAMRLVTAALAGEVSGADGSTITIRNAVADSKDRIVASVDAYGNRTSVTTDVSD